MQKVTFWIPDDQALLAVVGEVSIRHGQLDRILQLTIKSIAGLQISEALKETRRYGSARLRKYVREHAGKRFGQPALDRLEALLIRCETVTNQRNKLMHAVWARDAEGNSVIQGDVTEPRMSLPRVEDLKMLADQIGKLAFEINGARLYGFIKDEFEK